MSFSAHKLWWKYPDKTGLVWDDLGQQDTETRIYSLAYLENRISLAGTAPNAKIFRSIDYGLTWTDLGRQGTEYYIQSLAYLENGIALAGTGPKTAFCNQDGNGRGRSRAKSRYRRGFFD